MSMHGRQRWLGVVIAAMASVGAVGEVAAEQAPPLPMEELFNRGCTAYGREDWQQAGRYFRQVAEGADVDETVRKNAAFYWGIAEYQQGELEAANAALSIYLKQRQSAEHFMETIEYKFSIAEQLRSGAKTRLFASSYMPKWGNGSYLALDIYDEITLAVPSHEYAVRSLYTKGGLLAELALYPEAIIAYQTLLRRFPKHELAPQACYCILGVYLQQAQSDRQNADILPLARLALEKFRLRFPRDERVASAEKLLAQIEELSADSLYQMGTFYERIEAPRSAVLYYAIAVRQFPQTPTAEHCRRRLRVLSRYVPESLPPEIIPTAGPSTHEAPAI